MYTGVQGRSSAKLTDARHTSRGIPEKRLKGGKKMKKSKLLALAMASVLTVSSLAGCGGNSSQNSTTPAKNDSTTAAPSSSGSDVQKETQPVKENTGKPITDLVTYETTVREVESWNILYSQVATDFDVLTNLLDGLVACDPYGKLTPAIASSWETPDNGLTWTFHLRDDVKWVDVNGNEKAALTSADFITGLEWVMNSHKNNATNISMPVELIKGASEYYELTKEMEKEEALALDTSTFLEMVGIEAPDDYTLTYTCVSEKPYFDTVAAYACLYPAPQALIDELGIDGFIAVQPDNMWYSGPYTMTSYIQGNEKIYTKNPAYYNTECTRFDTVTVKMVESLDVAYQLYQSGDLDNVDLTESALTTISNNTGSEFFDQRIEKRPRKYSFCIHFNYGKNKEDGTPDTNWNTAVANTAFRQSWYYGLDLSSWYARTNSINPLTCENNAYTMRGLCYNSEGKDYVDMVQEKLGIGEYNGSTMVRIDSAKGQELKAQAMQELSAQGVTFPVEIDYYISASSQTALDSATVLKQAFSDSLGDDYVKLNIKTYVSSLAKEVRNPSLHSIVINGWGADYGDPQNFLGQEIYGEDNAYYSVMYAHPDKIENEETVEIYKEFTKMVNEANAINDDLDKRYEAYAEAEAYYIENAIAVPCYYEIAWELTHINDYSKINALYGIVNNKMINWQTSVDAYTTDQYAAFKAAYEAGQGN